LNHFFFLFERKLNADIELYANIMSRLLTPSTAECGNFSWIIFAYCLENFHSKPRRSSGCSGGSRDRWHTVPITAPDSFPGRYRSRKRSNET
jgi:hypothetical protein